MRLWKILITIGAVGFSAPAFAWGDDGHRLVCQIAYEILDAPAKAKVDALMAVSPSDSPSFAGACTYADKWRSKYQKSNDIKARSAHHFINMRRTAQEITDESCGVATKEEGCAFTAIRADFDFLRDHTKNAKDRARALLFMAHFVGDIHQPLHISFKDDRGGGSLRTTGDCGELGVRKMHAVWDSCIIRKFIYQRSVKPEKFFTDPLFHSTAATLAKVSGADAAQWLAEPRFKWGQESYVITTSPAVGYCVWTKAHDKCARVTSKRLYVAPTAYSKIYAPDVQKRLQQAGVRLAALLKEAL